MAGSFFFSGITWKSNFHSMVYDQVTSKKYWFRCAERQIQWSAIFRSPTVRLSVGPCKFTISHYLQSNQVPSDDETRELKALRTNPLEEISTIDLEIDHIEGILNSLRRKRAHIQESIDDFNTILAPVRRLSADVLGLIFSYCLATHRNPVMSASEAPTLLTQICRDWRSFALSIPRLWSRLYIPILRNVRQYRPEALDGKRRMKARTEEVRRWLRLSAACPWGSH